MTRRESLKTLRAYRAGVDPYKATGSSETCNNEEIKEVRHEK